MPIRFHHNDIHLLSKELKLDVGEKAVMDKYLKADRTRSFIKPSEIFRKRGYLDEAIDILEEGLSHYPDFNTGRVLLARNYFSRGDIKTAKAHLESIMDELVDNQMALKVMLQIHILQDDEEWVKKRFDELQGIFAFDKEVNGLYDSFLSGGLISVKEKVVRDFGKRGIKLKIAITSDSDSSTNSAEDQTQKELLPSDIDSKAYYDEFQIVKTGEVFNSWIKSVEEVDPTTIEHPEILTVAELHFQKGDWQQALAAYHEALRFYPDEKIERRIVEIEKAMKKGIRRAFGPNSTGITLSQKENADQKIRVLTEILKRIETRS